VVQFAYVDETGSVGTGAAQQPYLTLVAVLIHEDNVQPLSHGMRKVAFDHLGWLPDHFEFHGHEIWNHTGWWSQKDPPDLIAAYEAAIGLLDRLDLTVARSSIDKEKLHERYDGAADANAYRLALQFLLEKIDKLVPQNRIVVVDEAKEQQLPAIKMVADMQRCAWGGEVPGRTLETVIDSLHFVRSNASPGVQMADLVAYIIQRYRRNNEHHPNAAAALFRLADVIHRRTVTWREPWPK